MVDGLKMNIENLSKGEEDLVHLTIAAINLVSYIHCKNAFRRAYKFM